MVSYYRRGHPISSILCCNIHVEYKWVLANVSKTCGNFEERKIVCSWNREPLYGSPHLIMSLS